MGDSVKFRAPTSFEEILTDGYMIQAEYTEAWQRATAPIQEVEFQDVANFYQVRVYTKKKIQTFTATRVASIQDGTWYWHNHYRFQIPELLAPQPYHLDLMRAARTLHGNAPAMVVPQGNSRFEVIVIDPHQLPTIPLQHSLPLALAAVPRHSDLAKALTAYAGFRGEPLQHFTAAETYSGREEFHLGQYRIDAATRTIEGATHLRDLNADAWYPSIEAQYFYEAHQPPTHLPVNLNTGEVCLGNTSTSAVLVGTITDSIFRWSFNDACAWNLPVAHAAHEIKRFAVDHNVVELLRPHYPAEDLADVIEYVRATKPILGRWVHAAVQLDATTEGIVLLQGDALALPPLRAEVAQAVLDNPIPQQYDAQRALQFYARLRQVRVTPNGNQLLLPTGEIVERTQ